MGKRNIVSRTLILLNSIGFLWDTTECICIQFKQHCGVHTQIIERDCTYFKHKSINAEPKTHCTLDGGHLEWCPIRRSNMRS